MDPYSKDRVGRSAGPSVPRGFTSAGLPVGVEIVGRHRGHQDEWDVLQFAHAFERATGFWKRRPPVAELPTRRRNSMPARLWKVRRLRAGDRRNHADRS